MSLLIFIIISLCIGCWVWKQRNRFILNSDSLHKQWLFRLAIAFPLVSSIYFIVWLGAPYPFRFDSYGYNAFLEINKFPLGILALSPILGVFVVYSHRSLQTEKQIKTAEKQLEEAQKKNKVDIYFSQRKYIIEQLENIQIPHYGKIENANYVYDRFRKFDNYNDKKNTESFNFVNSQLNELHESLIYIKNYVNNFSYNGYIPTKLNTTLAKIQKSITLIISTSGIKNNGLEIKNIISSFNDECNIYIANKVNHLNNYNSDFKAELDFLLQDIIIELSALYYSLQKLFTIILLDEDISKFIPNLEKFNSFQFP
ncbi:TPA: hypothetical protein ACRRWE_001047 [Morganella morganii]